MICAMKAKDRAYRDMQIVLGRAAGASYAELAQKVELSERYPAPIRRSHDLEIRFPQLQLAQFDGAAKRARGLTPS
jgi:hypothetical protein